MGKKHKKHKHASRQEHEGKTNSWRRGRYEPFVVCINQNVAVSFSLPFPFLLSGRFQILLPNFKAPGFGDKTLSEMRVVFQLPRTVQVGQTQETRSTHTVAELLVSIPLDALRPPSPAEEPEPISPAAERKHHKHKKHKKNKHRHSDSHREADNRLSDDLPVDADESPPRPAVPLKFSYKIQPTPPRLPPPPPLIHTPEPSGHSKSGKQRHAFPAGDSSEAESPVVATRGSTERRGMGKPTTLAGLESLSESDSQQNKKRKHKHHHHHRQEGAASCSPMGGDKAIMASQLVGKEPSTLSTKKAKLDIQSPAVSSLAGEPSVGVSKGAIESKTGVSKVQMGLSPRLLLDPARTRSSSVTSNSHSFPSRPTTPHGRPLTPTASAANMPTPPQGCD